MKTLKYILSTLILIAVVWSCDEDEFGNMDFVATATAPTNVSALFKITQDNTGFVSIAPSADGGVSFEITYGDETGEAAKMSAGESTTHTYAEGTYSVTILAKGITGLATSATKELVVSFQAPQFGTEPIIENDAAKTKQVNVTVPDDTIFAMFFDVYFVEDGVETIITGNVGDTVSFTYANPGLVEIKVVLKGGAIATAEYVVTDFEVTEILQPITPAPYVVNRSEADYISIFSDAYINIEGSDFNPWWWQETQFNEFNLDGDNMLQYANLNYQGIQIGSELNVTSMETLHIDVWSAEENSINFFPLPVGISAENEKYFVLELQADQWNSFDIPLSYFTDQGLPLDQIHQFKFEGSGTIFIDNIYFYKVPSAPSILTGTWKLAPEAYAFKVGPAPNNGDWWGNNTDDITTRACYFDDEYIFATDGSFSNVLGAETWLETWQGVDSEQCGTPVAPYDGTANGAYSYDDTAGTLTISGTGAYLGLPKANNAGELPNVAVPSSITYNVTLTDNNNTMIAVVDWGDGVYWTYKFLRKISPIVGTWKLAPEAYAFKVGPEPNNGDWWGNSTEDITTRACIFDDEFVFSSDGTFSNVLGNETWLETWQGVDSEQCGAPVAPHDGSGFATYSFNETAGTLTLNGSGAFLGLPKANNEGELPNVAVPDSISYNVTLSDNNNTMIAVVDWGDGVFWTYKFVKN